MDLTEEQVLAMAPDESSRKAGKELAKPAKWVSTGFSEAALWGECQGSGSKPYQTQVDTGAMAFRCSCPSRKFPCKHGVGLLLYYAREKASFVQQEQPAWVTEWISKRTEKAEKKAQQTTEAKPVDEAAQNKRMDARHRKVSDGLEELVRWTKDLIRNGIIGLPDKGADMCENMARRMVDAQASGLAAILREMAEISYYSEGWQQTFMDQLLRLYLAAQAYSHLDKLEPSLQQDIRTLIGYSQSQEELKTQIGVTDTWLVLGKQSTEDDRLITERYWLYGLTTRRPALVLQFTIRHQPQTQLMPAPGSCVRAELVYYPSAAPMRALIKTQQAAPADYQFRGHAGWTDVMAAQTQVSSQWPLYNDQVYTIAALTPVQRNGQWWLRDEQEQEMQLRPDFRSLWKLLALSGGQPLPMVVIGRETQYEPIGVWYQQEYKVL
ncbi:SWIM zinc finger family protein [Chitinophaga sp. G-6-1-13]|uniref:SWIM zinc finger family protein n=1 Tax=Chitinophaga fulva TaxID=2728842 RepID=A0A848GL14_9BACT|nr:SWIM zinc finger family protein [Chitinophaga fulva]NML38607.1 SWIM zinc finger family protein [Chitinophaga fulva]